MLMRRIVVVAAAVVLGFAALGFCQAPPAGGIGGRLADESGAALPGVTVTVSCPAAGGVIATVTDGTGEYSVAGLPVGPCTVVFELSGFATSTHERVSVSADQRTVVNAQLALAGVKETVTVVGQAPPEHVVEVPKPRPRVQAAPVVAHEMDSVCGPGRPTVKPSGARLAGSRMGDERAMYAPGDAIVVDAGSAAGLAVGQNFVVRRTYQATDFTQDQGKGKTTVPVGVHAAGLVQVVEVSDTSALVAVVYACDEFERGDELEPFTPQPFRMAKAGGAPDYYRPARVLFGDQGKMLGAPGRLMVIDQGQDAGLEAGQRVTLFRPSRLRRGTALPIGEGVIVTVRGDWSRIRIESVQDVVYAGDQAAPRR